MSDSLRSLYRSHIGRCCLCDAPSVALQSSPHGMACAPCIDAADQVLAAWRHELAGELAGRVARWVAVIPPEDLDLLLFSLLDNSIQAVFGVTDRIINLEEAAEHVAALNPAERQALLPALICHRLSDSLWTWRALACYAGLSGPTPQAVTTTRSHSISAS